MFSYFVAHAVRIWICRAGKYLHNLRCLLSWYWTFEESNAIPFHGKTTVLLLKRTSGQSPSKQLDEVLIVCLREMGEEEAQVVHHPWTVIFVAGYTGTTVEVDFSNLYTSPHEHPSPQFFSESQLSASLRCCCCLFGRTWALNPIFSVATYLSKD